MWILRRLLESKIEAEKNLKMKELDLMDLLENNTNYESSPLQKELFELLKVKRVIEIELARWEMKQVDEQIKQIK